MSSGDRPSTRTPSREDGAVSEETDLGFSVEHRLRRSAGSATTQESAPAESRNRERVVRDLAILGFAVFLGLAVASYADVANVEHQEARDIAHRIDSAWESIVGGSAVPEEAAAAAGLDVYTFEVDGRPRTILTHAQPTSGGACYALRYGDGLVTIVGVFEEPATGCAPQLPIAFERSGSWSDVLPSERKTSWWFVPFVMLLFCAGLYAVTDIPIVLLTKRR